jgi:hypothetical protein
MNQRQQWLQHQKEQGGAYLLEQQRKAQDARRRAEMDGVPYVPVRGSVLGSFIKGLLTLTILAALAFGAFVILNRLGVFN